LSNAQLDHADFAGANLTKVNLCGASLHHAWIRSDASSRSIACSAC
jgi:uncharacterized protein YjbI with pentapeptide repeats